MMTLKNDGKPLLIHKDPLNDVLFAWWRLGDRPDDDSTATTGAMHDDGPYALTLTPTTTSGTEIVSGVP